MSVSSLSSSSSSAGFLDFSEADRLKLLYWDGTGLVTAYKRLEEATFIWPAIKDGVMALNHAQFEALFAGLDWRKVKALETRPPAAAE